MLWLAAAFAVGILAAKFVNIDLPFAVAACGALAGAAAILRKHQSATFLVLAAFASAGLASSNIETNSVSPNRIRLLYDNGTVRSGDPVEVEGVLLGRPEPSVDGVFLTLRTEKLKYHGSLMDVSGVVRLFLQQNQGQDASANRQPDLSDPTTEISNLKSEIPDLKYGSRIAVACKLQREDEFLNPGVMPKREMLDRLGVDATGSVKSPRLIEKIADESVFMPLAWVYDQRAQIIADFKNNLNRRTAGVMIASLLGDKYFLDKDTSDLFREGGTFHILVISGLHITFIGGLLLLFLKQLTRNRWIQFAATTTVLWAYTLAVGADVPVVRAAIMFTIVLYSYVIYRQSSLLNSLGICGLILLVLRPSDLFNPSFLLTFVSVGAIVVIAYPLIETLRLIGKWTPTPDKPFPPNVPVRLKNFCEMLYWSGEAWAVESKRQIWTAKLFKTPYLSRRINGVVRTLLRYLFEGVLVSLIVQICMLPLSVVYFHRVSVVSVLLNLWVGLFIALESFAAVIGVLISKFSGLLAAGFFAIAEIFNWVMLAVPRLFADNGWASFRLPAYSGAGKAIYFWYLLPVLVIAFALNKWKPFELKPFSGRLMRPVLISAMASLAVLAGVIVFHPFSSPSLDRRLHIDFLDVGQGDSALVTFPDGRTLLVDGGGKVSYKAGGDELEPFERDVRSIGDSVVSEFLWYRGYARVDYILATHADADHIQGLADVAKNFTVRAAFFGRTPMSDPDFAFVAGVLKLRGIPSETIARSDHLEFGDVTVEVLYPAPTDDLNAVSDNDHSVVLRIVMGSRAFLLTGDIEKSAEAALVADGGTLAADLIKVPHHGSRTSSTQEFIDAVGVKFAVISVGRTSPFGHPHPEVVERWKTSGAKVMTTGELGTISVSTDGKDLVIDHFLP